MMTHMEDLQKYHIIIKKDYQTIAQESTSSLFTKEKMESASSLVLLVSLSINNLNVVCFIFPSSVTFLRDVMHSQVPTYQSQNEFAIPHFFHFPSYLCSQFFYHSIFLNQTNINVKMMYIHNTSTENYNSLGTHQVSCSPKFSTRHGFSLSNLM